MHCLQNLVILCAPFVLIACGGGGSSTPPAPVVSLSGQLSIPNFGSSPGDGELFDGDAAHARAVGAVTAGARLSFADRVGPPEDDRLDVLRIELGSGTYAIDLTATDRIDDRNIAALHVIEAATGRQLRQAASGTTTVVRATIDTRIDLVVEAIAGSSGYQLTIEPSADPTELQVPLDAAQPTMRTPAQARYLGAHHEMLPGEVVVLLDSVRAEGPEFDATPAGLVPVEDGRRGDLRVFRVAAPAPTSVGSGAPIEASLEIETCLAARRAAALPGVRAAAPNYVRRAATVVPNDPFYQFQWHYKIIGMEQAWSVTTGSTDVVVAVADTGIVSAHPDLSGRLIAGFDFISDPNNARDGDGRDNDPEDPGDLSSAPNSSWHGTHVAGTIGARSDNGAGVAGMDWACRLMPLRVLGVNGGSSADIMEAVKFAAGIANASGTTPAVPRGRADVLNLSLGGTGSSPVEQAIYADARARGLLVVCAAGNDGTTEPGFPASYPTNLSVGAVRFDKTRSSYSNRATTVDVMAPGGDLSVDQNGDNYGDGVLSTSAQADKTPVFVFENGTSMAAPHVAGLASLLLAAQPGATPAQLEGWILQNAEDLGAPGVDPVFQNGLIDPNASLLAATNQGPGGPVLRANPVGISLDATTSAAQVALLNAGDTSAGQPVLNVTQVDVDTGTDSWLGATLVADPSPATSKISHNAVALTVDRTGLASGRYTGSIAVRSSNALNAAPVTVTVAIEVGQTSTSEEIFVLLVELIIDGENVQANTIGQASTNGVANYRYVLRSSDAAPIPVGAYLLVAGTDRDGDDFVGDEGELFGVWPISDSPELVPIDAVNTTLSNLDFAVSESDQLPSSVRRGYALLR